MMMVLWLKANSLAFTPTTDEMSEAVSLCFFTDNYGWATYPRSLRSGSR